MAIIQNKPIYTLQEISEEIKDVLDANFERSFWVKTEINKLNHYTYSGHCYPELVDKLNGKVVAQMRSVLWKTDFERINASFIRTIKEPLKDGIKVMMLCTITFDAVYGLSLRIHDIDPSYSLGDLELEKQQSLDKLKEQGLIDRNKGLELPLIPQRIAIVSVETSKGYVDFMQVIDGNPWGYKFFHMLFPAVLQGENAIKDIQYQLKRISKVKRHFDVVAIIRGGGGDVGLSCYNDFSLAKTIAEFPLPVLSGIGHATNMTVVEMVSHTNAITPTKLGELLIQQYHNFSEPLERARVELISKARTKVDACKRDLLADGKNIKSQVLEMISSSKLSLNQSAYKLSGQAKDNIGTYKSALTLGQSLMFAAYRKNLSVKSETMSRFSNTLKASTQNIIRNLKIELDKSNGDRLSGAMKPVITGMTTALRNQEQLVRMADPENILKRGFSITRVNGKSVSSVDQLELESSIETEFLDGKTTSIIRQKTRK